MPTTKKDPALAAILSFLCTGLGQVYIGKVARGIVFFFLTVLGYCLWLIPGIILHIVFILDAYYQVQKLNETKEK